jgi:asparagine N-glycosylation enzyme membrane subunit Stt3
MAASAANPWYETIAEFGAALFSRQTPLKSELLGLLAPTGLCLAALPAGCWAVARRWRKNPGTRQALVLLIVWFSLLLMLSAARVRFMIYVSAPLGIVSAFGVSEFCRSTANRLAGRHSEVAWRGMTVAGLLLLLAPAYWLLGPPAPAVDPLLASVARWIALAAPPNAVVRGVLAPWAAGHSLRVSGLPVVGSPFGTDVSRASMEDEGTFYATLSEREAEDVLSRRRVGYVMVHWPLSTVGNIQAYFGGSRSVIVDRSLARGRTLEPASTFAGTVAARLFYADGMPLRPNDGPSLGGLRLLREELPPQSPGVVPREQVKLFGVVRGVRLVVSGLLPGTRATATVPILTNQGRTFLWQTSLIGDTGSVVLRVPYATGANGEVRARPCTITDGLVSRTLDVPEDAVVSGTRLDVALR